MKCLFTFIYIYFVKYNITKDTRGLKKKGVEGKRLKKKKVKKNRIRYMLRLELDDKTSGEKANVKFNKAPMSSGVTRCTKPTLSFEGLVM